MRDTMSLTELLTRLNELNHFTEDSSSLDTAEKLSNFDCSCLHSYIGSNSLINSRWNLVQGLCVTLLKLKECITADSLLSVKEIGIIRTSCRNLLSHGVVSLLPFSLSHWPRPTFDLSSTTPNERNMIIEMCMRVFMNLLMCPFLADILKNDITSIMAGLFYMLFYVKPPPKDRDFFKSGLVNIVDGFYQPDVIRSVMVLHCSKGANKKICAAVREILIKKMMKEGGVLLLVTTVLTESANTCDIVKVAKLIVNQHPVPGYMESVMPQVLTLLDNKNSGCQQMGSQCFLILQETNPALCEVYLTTPLLQPLFEVSSEIKLENCLQRLTSIFSCTDCSVAPWFIARRAVESLCQMYCSIHKSVCHLKKNVKSLILQCIENAPEDKLQDLMFVVCFPPTNNINFVLADSGGVQCVQEQWIPYLDDPINSFLDVISSSSKFKSILYFTLLEKFSSFSVDQKLIASNTLSNLSTDTEILKNLSEEPSPIIVFIRLLLVDKSSDEDTLLLGLVILNIVMNDKVMNRKRNWSLFDPLVEPLKTLRSNSCNGELRVLADDILNSLLTKGVAGTSDALPTDLNSVRISEEKSDYDSAMEDISDPHLPVRAHAVRELGHLLLTRDSSALKNKEQLLAHFKKQLQDTDSYMYLSSIEALSCAAAEFPDEVLNILCDQFNHSADIETRMKIGEVLLKTVRNLGEMAAVYKKELVHTFLVGCRDDNHLLRASSLSNLGELCQILSFRIGPYVIEVFECVQSIFSTDPELEPRRSAVMVVALLLKGLGSDLFTILEPVLLDLYRKLKLIYCSENDSVIKLHAQIALEELEVHTRALLFSENKLIKKISILDV